MNPRLTEVLDLIGPLLPRRSRSNAVVVTLVCCLLFLTLCSHIHQQSHVATHRQRRLRWYVYEDSNDGPAHAPRVVIPAVSTSKPSSTTTTEPKEEPAQKKKSLQSNSLYIDHNWATPDHDFTAESNRFLNLIRSVDENKVCSNQLIFEQVCSFIRINSQMVQNVCCLTEELNSGVVYSFNLDQAADVQFERRLLRQTETEKVFVFNPNYDPMKVNEIFETTKVRRDAIAMEAEEFKSESEEIQKFSFYKVALDTQSSQNPSRRWRRKTFQEIRKDLGHEKIDLMRINMKSSEWKVLRHWLESGEMSQIDQILVKVHLHWAGFGLTGDDGDVVHQWYNTISSMIESGLKLVSTQAVEDGPKTFLGKNQFDTSCCYYLTFFRT